MHCTNGLAALFGLLTLCASPCRAGVEYLPVDLGVPGEASSYPIAINEAGRVLLNSTAVDGSRR